MKLYPIFSTLIDVFQGEGWENWSRVSIKRGKAQVIAGGQLTDEQLSEIVRRAAK
jgi:hypothetical protein